MKRFLLHYVITLLLLCVAGYADFPYVTFTNQFAVSQASGSYTNFSWKMNDWTDYRLSVRFDAVGFSNILFRMAYPKGGDSYLTVYGGILTTTTTHTLYTAMINRTNIPYNGVYFAEFLAANTAEDGTNTVYSPSRVLANGMVETEWSVFSATNAVSRGNVNIIIQLGTNAALLESDPIWSAEKSLYATTNLLATGGFLKAETDYVFTNWLATNTFVKSETDPAFTNWLATNTYTATETDPVWSAASNRLGTNIVMLLADSEIVKGYTNRAASALASSVWAGAQSTTNYAVRTVYQAFTSAYAVADSTTNYMWRDRQAATNAAFSARDAAQVNSNVNMTVRITSNTTRIAALEASTPDAITNYMWRDVQLASNAAMTARITTRETNAAAMATSVLYRTGGVVSGGMTNRGGIYITDEPYIDIYDAGQDKHIRLRAEDNVDIYVDAAGYTLMDYSGNIPFARMSSALSGENVRLGSLILAMEQYGTTVMTNGALNVDGDWTWGGNAGWGVGSNMTFAAGAGTATYIPTNQIVVPGRYLLTYSMVGASATNYVTNYLGGVVIGVATVRTVSATYSNAAWARSCALELRGTPGDAVYLDNFALRRDTNGDVRVANRLDAYQLYTATRPLFQGQPAAYSGEVAQVRTDIGTASNALTIVLTNAIANNVLTSNAVQAAYNAATNAAANNVLTSNRAEAAYALADAAPTYAEASNSYVRATGESRAITLGGVLTVSNQAVFGAGSSATGSYSTVSGGSANSAAGEFSTVAGGHANSALSDASTVSGGTLNDAEGDASTVSGGALNDAEGVYSTVAGGRENSAAGSASTVAGGRENSAAGDYSAVAGGLHNSAGGSYSLAAGLRAKATNDGAFVWGDSVDADKGQGGGANSATFHASGGFYHIDGTNILSSSDGALTMNGVAVGGSAAFSYDAFGNLTATGATAAIVATNSFVGGGTEHQLYGTHSVIGGGRGNYTAVGSGAGHFAVVAGGQSNAAGAYSVVGGGGTNSAQSAIASVVGGGTANAIGGGQHNTIGGGRGNDIAASRNNATIAGGIDNYADGFSATIGGGDGNAILGGGSAYHQTIVGGNSNLISGAATWATVLGGTRNWVTAGLGIALGRSATASNWGAFVWADDPTQTDANYTLRTNAFGSKRANEFALRANGGVRIAAGSLGVNRDTYLLATNGLHIYEVLGAHPTPATNTIIIYQYAGTGVTVGAWVMRGDGYSTQISAHDDAGNDIRRTYDAVTGIERTVNMTERDKARAAAWEAGRNFEDVRRLMLAAETSGVSEVKAGPTWAERMEALRADRVNDIEAWEKLPPTLDGEKPPRPQPWADIAPPGRTR